MIFNYLITLLISPSTTSILSTMATPEPQFQSDLANLIHRLILDHVPVQVKPGPFHAITKGWQVVFDYRPIDTSAPLTHMRETFDLKEGVMSALLERNARGQTLLYVVMRFMQAEADPRLAFLRALASVADGKKAFEQRNPDGSTPLHGLAWEDNVRTFRCDNGFDSPTPYTKEQVASMYSILGHSLFYEKKDFDNDETPAELFGEKMPSK